MSAALLLDAPRPVRVIGVDPGTTHIGLCVSEVQDDGLHVIDAYTVHTDTLVRRHYMEVAERYGERYALIAAGVDAIVKYIRTWSPGLVAYESPYLGRHPQAFGSGVEIMTMVAEAIRRADPFLVFLTLDPSSVKKSIGVNGKSGDKSLMALGIKRSPHLTLGIDTDALDEHAVDSIAVGLAVFRNLIK